MRSGAVENVPTPTPTRSITETEINQDAGSATNRRPFPLVRRVQSPQLSLSASRRRRPPPRSTHTHTNAWFKRGPRSTRVRRRHIEKTRQFTCSSEDRDRRPMMIWRVEPVSSIGSRVLLAFFILVVVILFFFRQTFPRKWFPTWFWSPTLLFTTNNKD